MPAPHVLHVAVEPRAVDQQLRGVEFGYDGRPPFSLDDHDAMRITNRIAAFLVFTLVFDAIAHAQKLVEDPTFPVPWKALTNLGWAQFKSGRIQEARESLELALEYDDRHTAAVLGLAVVEMEAGKHLEALQYFDHVLELEPGPLVRAEANYRIGEIYVALGNRTKAMQHLTAASQTEPSGEWGKRSKDYLRRLR